EARGADVAAQAAAAAAPAGFALVGACSVGGQPRAADGDHVTGHRRPDGRGAVVSRGGEERDSGVAGRRREVTVVCPFADELAAAPLRRDGVTPGYLRAGF